TPVSRVRIPPSPPARATHTRQRSPFPLAFASSLSMASAQKTRSVIGRDILLSAAWLRLGVSWEPSFMKLLRDLARRLRGKARPSLVVFVLKKSAISPANRLRAALLLAALLAAAAGAVRAQKTGRPAESPLMRQLQQALSLAGRGDKPGAMNLVLRLLEQHPEFAPAIKLKGMLLEQEGRPADAAAAYEQALKLAPNDPDLLLLVGTYKLNAGQKEEAIELLEQCVRILPGDGDAQYYLAQAYHLNGQDELA